jgi:RNA polymerase subunit RPABC4/transcription elongation factor Spt4
LGGVQPHTCGNCGYAVNRKDRNCPNCGVQVAVTK